MDELLSSASITPHLVGPTLPVIPPFILPIGPTGPRCIEPLPHQFIKKRIGNMLGLKSLQTAKKMIVGIEVMHIIKKGQTL